eukprot:8341905-Pyramimonas_sp.AAC.1
MVAGAHSYRHTELRSRACTGACPPTLYGYYGGRRALLRPHCATLARVHGRLSNRAYGYPFNRTYGCRRAQLPLHTAAFARMHGRSPTHFYGC